MRRRQVWRARDVWAGWGLAYRTQFARGDRFSRTGSRKYPVGSEPVCAPVFGGAGLMSLCTWSEVDKKKGPQEKARPTILSTILSTTLSTTPSTFPSTYKWTEMWTELWTELLAAAN